MSMEKKQSTGQKDFEEATPVWYEQFPEEFKKRSCPICGIIPENLNQLAKNLSSEREALLREILEEVEKMIHHRRTIGCSVGHINTLTELQEIIKKKI